MENQFDDVESLDEIKKRIRRKRLLSAALALLLVAAVLLFSRCDAAREPAVPSATPVPAAQNAVSEAAIEKGLFVAFLDVGQGDCIFLRAPDGKTMLVDAGPVGSYRVIRRFLVAQGVQKLDVVVATHLHEDHIGGMREVLERYEVGTLYLSPFDIESSAYAELVKALDEANVAAVPVYAAATSVLPWSDAPDTEVRVLSPYEVRYDDENDTSLVLRVRFGATAVLLMGDATEVSERLAIKAQKNHNLEADVLKVGHHGAASSTSNKLLSVVKPQLAVISVGGNNDYGHPSAAVLARLANAGAQVLRTDELGTIRILLDGTNVTVIE